MSHVVTQSLNNASCFTLHSCSDSLIFPEASGCFWPVSSKITYTERHEKSTLV